MGEKVVANPNCVTTFESYSLDYKRKISKVTGRISKAEALVCPEMLKSPSGKEPSTTWRLEVLQHPKLTQSHGTYTTIGTGYNVAVTLTSCSYTTIWANVNLGTKVKDTNYREPRYCTKYLSISPDCYMPQTCLINIGSSFTGVIPSHELHKYINGEDLIIQCRIFVNKLEQPATTSCGKHSSK